MECLLLQALEGRASEAKEAYVSDMAAYKYTAECQDYEEYLVSCDSLPS